MTDLYLRLCKQTHRLLWQCAEYLYQKGGWSPVDRQEWRDRIRATFRSLTLTVHKILENI